MGAYQSLIGEYHPAGTDEEFIVRVLTASVYEGSESDKSFLNDYQEAREWAADVFKELEFLRDWSLNQTRLKSLENLPPELKKRFLEADKENFRKKE